jgi:hypothetical protein
MYTHGALFRGAFQSPEALGSHWISSLHFSFQRKDEGAHTRHGDKCAASLRFAGAALTLPAWTHASFL